MFCQLINTIIIKLYMWGIYFIHVYCDIYARRIDLNKGQFIVWCSSVHGFLMAADLQIHKAFHRKSSQQVFRDTDVLRAVFQKHHKSLSNVLQALYMVRAINESLESHRWDPRKTSRDDVHQLVQGLFEYEGWPMNSLNCFWVWWSLCQERSDLTCLSHSLPQRKKVCNSRIVPVLWCLLCCKSSVWCSQHQENEENLCYTIAVLEKNYFLQEADCIPGLPWQVVTY